MTTCSGTTEAGPGIVSPSGTVPTVVPSDSHSSCPELAEVAANNRAAAERLQRRGDELGPPGLMSRTILVPPGVPSLRHSSQPVAGTLADEEHQPGRMGQVERHRRATPHARRARRRASVRHSSLPSPKNAIPPGPAPPGERIRIADAGCEIAQQPRADVVPSVTQGSTPTRAVVGEEPGARPVAEHGYRERTE